MQIDTSNQEYKKWFSEIKSKIQQRQIKAAIKVNTELLDFVLGTGPNYCRKAISGQMGGWYNFQVK